MEKPRLDRKRKRLLDAAKEGKNFAKLSPTEKLKLADELIYNAIKLKEQSEIVG
jgi:hypothetical protein